MTEDGRTSRTPESGTVDIPSGDSGNYTALELTDEQSFSLEELRVDYGGGGSASTVVEVYDDDSSTTSGSESDLVDKYRLTSGEEKNTDMVYREIEEDVIVTTSGNQDDDITVTVGGFIVSG